MAGRLTCVVDAWDPRRGGLEAYACALADGLVARGLPVDVVCGRSAPGATVPVRTLGGAGIGFLRAVDRAAAAGQLGELLSFRHPGPRARVFLPLGGLFVDALEARRAAEVPWRRAVRRLARALSPRTRAFLARERAFFARDDSHALVLAASQRTADAIGRRFPGFRGAVVVTGLPIDPQRFEIATSELRASARATLGIGASTHVVLWSGHDARRKGRDQALAVLRALRVAGLDVVLLLVGRGSLGAPAADPAVRVLGPRDDVERLLAAADVLLHPTFEDNFALAVVEALAAGVPVVTTRFDGAAERVVELPCGVVVDAPHDIAALRDACRAAFAVARDGSHAAARRAAVADCFAPQHFDRVAALLAPFVATPLDAGARPRTGPLSGT